MVVGSPHHLFNFLLSYCVHFNFKNVHITGCFTICIHCEILHGAGSQMHGSTLYCFLCVMATLSLFVTGRVCYLLPPLTVLYKTRNLSFEQYQPTFFCPTTVRTHSSLLWDLLRSHLISCGIYLVEPGLFHVTQTLLVHPCYRKWLRFLFYKAVSYSTVYVDHLAFVHSSADLCWGWVRMSAIGLRLQLALGRLVWTPDMLPHICMLSSLGPWNLTPFDLWPPLAPGTRQSHRTRSCFVIQNTHPHMGKYRFFFF